MFSSWLIYVIWRIPGSKILYCFSNFYLERIYKEELWKYFLSEFMDRVLTDDDICEELLLFPVLSALVWVLTLLWELHSHVDSSPVRLFSHQIKSCIPSSLFFLKWTSNMSPSYLPVQVKYKLITWDSRPSALWPWPTTPSLISHSNPICIFLYMYLIFSALLLCFLIPIFQFILLHLPRVQYPAPAVLKLDLAGYI